MIAYILLLILFILILITGILAIDSFGKQFYFFMILLVLSCISVVFILYTSDKLKEKSMNDYNIQVTTYELQHIDTDSYYDIQGNHILIKVKDNLKTLNNESCNIKQSKDLPKLVENHYILKNKVYRKIFGHYNSTYYTIKVPTK